MFHVLARPKTLAFTLLFLSSIPVISAAVLLYQIPAGQLPEDSAKYNAVPWVLFLHVLGGFLFGVLGPFQFAGVLKRRFGRLHRLTGRVFVTTGLLLALSALRLVWQFPDSGTWILISARLVTGAALGTALVIAMVAIRRRDIARHKAWMIRAYAIGMGAATVSFLLFPIFLITGEAPKGYVADLVFVGSWVINIAIAEAVIRRPMARSGGTARA